MPQFLGTESPAALASFYTVERFLVSNIGDGSETIHSADQNALQQAYEAVRAHHAPPVVCGTTLMQKISTRTRLMPFGCDSIDALLDGGCREGQVVELYGDSGAGKTQLCMMMAARAASRGERVVFIDTSNSVSAIRILSMMKDLGSTKAGLEQATSLITIKRAYTAHAVLSTLDEILQKYSTPSTTTAVAVAVAVPNETDVDQRTTARPTKPVSVVIIDSIGAAMSATVGGGGASLQGHAILAAAAALIKEIAQSLHIAVIVTNHMVSSGSRTQKAGGAMTSLSSSSLSSSKVPALGESWHNQCHVRVQLCTPDSDGGPYMALLRKSTLIDAQAVAPAPYWIAAAGLVHKNLNTDTPTPTAAAD